MTYFDYDEEQKKLDMLSDTEAHQMGYEEGLQEGRMDRDELTQQAVDELMFNVEEELEQFKCYLKLTDATEEYIERVIGDLKQTAERIKGEYKC